MDDNEIRLRVLEFAYLRHKERGMQPSFRGMDFRENEITKATGIKDRGRIRLALLYLADKGYLDIEGFPSIGKDIYIAKITTYGIDFIEPPGPFNPKPLTTYIENSDAEESLKQEYREILKEIKGALEKAEAKNDELREKAPVIAETIGSFLAPIINKFLSPGP